jgi:hypothetical protein
MLQPLRINSDLGRGTQGIVNAQLFYEPAIARAAPIRRDDAVKWDLLAAAAGESDGH